MPTDFCDSFRRPDASKTREAIIARLMAKGCTRPQAEKRYWSRR